MPITGFENWKTIDCLFLPFLLLIPAYSRPHAGLRRAGRTASRPVGVSRKGLALREIRAGLMGTFAEWEVKDDLALLKQLELAQSRGYGRGAYWTLVNQ